MKKIIIIIFLVLISISFISLETNKVLSLDETETQNNVNHVSFDNTNIIGGLSSIKYLESKDELDNIFSLDYNPTTCIFNLDQNANIIFDNKETLTVENAIEALNGKIIPAFIVDDSNQIANLTSYLKENNYYDCFIISKDEEIIKETKEIIPEVSYVLDLNNNITLDTINYESIRTIVHTIGANLVILPVDVAKKEVVQKLYELNVNTWVELENNSLSEIYQGITSGALGVITDDTDLLTKTVKNNFNENTLTRLPINIAHTGMPRMCPENTIEGARLAYANGADSIELDIQLTTDNKLAIMHDVNTIRTCNENLIVEESTMEELKTLYVNRGYENNSRFNKCRIPELEEYFIEFKDKDINFSIEIKSYNTNIVQVLKDLIDKYEMINRVTIISFMPEQIEKVLELMPTASVALLQGEQTFSSDLEADLIETKKAIGKYNSTFNPNKNNFTKEMVAVYNSRGISIHPWTFSVQTEYTTAILDGYTSITGNRANIFKTIPKYLSVNYETKELYVNDSIELNLDITYYGGTTETINSKDYIVEIINTDRTDLVENNKITFTEKGDVSFIIKYSYDLNGTTVYYYSDVISFDILSHESVEKTKTKENTTTKTTINNNTTTFNNDNNENDDNQNSNGCFSFLNLGIISVVLVTGVISITTLKKKEEY